MWVISSIEEMKEWAKGALTQGQSIGFVPTMGYLHRGHLSLMEAARQENDYVVASVFVNPTQFGPGEDYERYPRDLESDSAQADAAGVDVLFCPEVKDMYPAGFATYVDPHDLSGMLCGSRRPGHFGGVCTVVLKLLNIVRPTRAYFGQKDAQQFIILDRMARDFDLGVEMVRMPIVREEDGLAMSSRNVYLSKEERRQALALSRALKAAEWLYNGGEKSAAVLRAAVEDQLRQAPLARVDYVEIVSLENLLPLETIDKPALLALAAFFGKTRLIDNAILE